MASPKQHTIVIVDDDPDIRMAAREICEMSGFDVIGEAGDGQEAIDLVRSLYPEAVVLDYMMPNMNGELAAGVIRAIAPDSKILAFSAIIESKPAWSDGFLAKSQIDRLPQTLTALLT